MDLSTVPMYAAVYRNHSDIVELFLKYGGKVDLDGSNEYVHCATGFNYGTGVNYRMSVLLAKHGAQFKTARGEPLIKTFEKHYSNQLGFPKIYETKYPDVFKVHELIKYGVDHVERREQRIAEEAARKKREAEEAERKRLAEIERKRQEAERQRLAEIERQKREAEEAERKRLAEIERQKREAEEAERKRMVWLNSDEYKRQQAEAERKRVEAEQKRKEDAERKRKEQEEEERKKKERTNQQGCAYLVWAMHHIDYLSKYGSFLPDAFISGMKRDMQGLYRASQQLMLPEQHQEFVSGLPQEYRDLLQEND